MLTLIYTALICLVSAVPFEHSEHHEHANSEPPVLLVRTLYEYPLGTWIENIAVRPTGELLLTLLNVPELHELDPSEANSTPQLVHRFSRALALSGIAEIDDDTFALSAGNFSFDNGPTSGSWSIWSVAFGNDESIEADVAKITDLPEATFLNGFCNLPSTTKPHSVLAGDIRKGTITRVNTTTGDHSVAISNNLTAVVPDPVFGEAGVNGIHVHHGNLYFANTGQGIFARIPIHPDGTPAGQPEVIAHVLNSTQEFDDFAIQGEYAYLVTGSGNSIERISLGGTPRGRIVAGSLNSTVFAEPTSAAFGRTEKDKHILYVVTGGGLATPVNGNITVGAQVLAVDTSMWSHTRGR